MNGKPYCLNDLPVGSTAAVSGLRTTGRLRRRLLDLGLAEGTRVECLGESPAGDPRAYLIRGTVIALRKKDCVDIFLRKEENGH